MNNIRLPKSFYHNEIVGALSINSVLKHGNISHAKAVLILPLLFHRETLDHLSSTNVRSIQTLTSTKSRLIAGFNKRYYSLLTISLNSILIGKQYQFFSEDDNELFSLKKELPYDSFGIRLEQIESASFTTYNLLSADSVELYKHFKIQL